MENSWAHRLFDGVFCPTITVLGSDGHVDYEAWGQHLDRLVDSGISGILVFGSIGEFHAFSVEERIEAIRFAADRISGRTRLLVGAADVETHSVRRLLECAGEVGGDAAVVISPYYFGPSSALAQSYFRTVGQISPVPVILYNFPDRTGNDLDVRVISSLAECPNIVGVKDTVDSMSHTRKIVNATRSVDPNFSVFSGFDEYYLGNRINGGSGVISGLTNVAPDLFVRMDEAYRELDWGSVVSAMDTVSMLMSIYDCADSFISAIKVAVSTLEGGFDTRLKGPFLPCSDSDVESVVRVLRECDFVTDGADR